LPVLVCVSHLSVVVVAAHSSAETDKTTLHLRKTRSILFDATRSPPYVTEILHWFVLSSWRLPKRRVVSWCRVFLGPEAFSYSPLLGETIETAVVRVKMLQESRTARGGRHSTRIPSLSTSNPTTAVFHLVIGSESVDVQPGATVTRRLPGPTAIKFDNGKGADVVKNISSSQSLSVAVNTPTSTLDLYEEVASVGLPEPDAPPLSLGGTTGLSQRTPAL
jgi:hypothetical protein